MRTMRMVVSCLAIGAMALTASAQPDRGGGAGGGDRPARGGAMQPREPLAPEKAKAAWELQATNTAKRLGLNEEKTKSLVKAYTAARESQAAGLEKLRKEADDRRKKEGGDDQGEARRGMGREAMQAMQDLNTAEREKFHKAVAGILTPEQTTKVTNTLGSFNPQWDRMVDTLAGFHLPADKQQTALNATEDYVGSLAKLRGEMGGGGDREEMQKTMREAREKLDTSMKGVLNEEQLSQFQATAGGPGMRGMGGGGGRGRGDGQGGGQGGGGGNRGGRGGGGQGGGGGF